MIILSIADTTQVLRIQIWQIVLKLSWVW
jgi:hypothetical protein